MFPETEHEESRNSSENYNCGIKKRFKLSEGGHLLLRGVYQKDH